MTRGVCPTFPEFLGELTNPVLPRYHFDYTIVSEKQCFQTAGTKTILFRRSVLIASLISNNSVYPHFHKEKADWKLDPLKQISKKSKHKPSGLLKALIKRK